MTHPGTTNPVFRLSRAENPPSLALSLFLSPSRIKRNEEGTSIIIIRVDSLQGRRKKKKERMESETRSGVVRVSLFVTLVPKVSESS